MNLSSDTLRPTFPGNSQENENCKLLSDDSSIKTVKILVYSLVLIASLLAGNSTIIANVA